MNVKEYLIKSFRIDEVIEKKVEQIERLRSLAISIGPVFTGMPGSGNVNIHKMEDTIVRLADEEKKLTEEIDMLVSIKLNIISMINSVKNRELHILLTERYINYKNWEEIAVSMRYNVRHIYRLHGAAIREIEKMDLKIA